MARLLVVDEEPVVRLGVASALAGSSRIEVCGEASSSAAALRLVAELNPDLVLAGIQLAGADGIELTKRIRALAPATRILVFTRLDDSVYVDRALRAGASGYVQKTAEPGELVEALLEILRGNVYVPPQLAARTLQRFVNGKPSTRVVDALTDRELEIFRLVGRGLGVGAVADRLHVSPKTVHAHLASIKRKLTVGSRTELIRRAVQWVLQDRGAS